MVLLTRPPSLIVSWPRAVVADRQVATIVPQRAGPRDRGGAVSR